MRGLNIGSDAAHLFAKGLKDFDLKRQALRGGALDAGVEIDQFGGNEAHLVGQALAVDELLFAILRGELVSQLLRQLNEIAEHIIELDANGDAGF